MSEAQQAVPSRSVSNSHRGVPWEQIAAGLSQDDLEDDSPEQTVSSLEYLTYFITDIFQVSRMELLTYVSSIDTAY